MSAAPTGPLPSVVLTGPIAGVGEPARGGFQACNRRTLDALLSRGVDVRALPYPHPKVGGLRKFVEYAGGFVRLYARAARGRPGSILHITALSGPFMYLQWLLLKIAKARGCRVIFDIRAGVAEISYRRGNRLYRAVYESVLRQADRVMVEGEAYIPFVTRITGRAPAYLPNHVDVAALPRRPEAPPVRAGDPMRLVYVGRVVSEKGLGLIVEAAQALVRAGETVSLAVAGDGEPAYLEQLRQQAQGLDVQWLGPVPSAEVLKLLRESHFFLFPTSHFGEGHSNSLTEAMASGCVPVASDHGFNAASIADAGVVLPVGSRGADYANVVLGIWRTPGRWEALSQAARQRAEQRFATGPVIAGLIEDYRRIAAG